MRHPRLVFALLLLCFLGLIGNVDGQTTAFTYQGRLLDTNLPATGSYDFEFGLFAAESGGTALATQSAQNVVVDKGIFSVTLDFGYWFPGADRWIEIAIKPTGSSNPPTVLNGRQPIRRAPYAIKSEYADEAISAESAGTASHALTADMATRAEDALNAVRATDASNLEGRPARDYVLTTDPRMSDARVPAPGSLSYIQSISSVPNSPHQTGNFSVGGIGSATILRAGSYFELGDSRILSTSGGSNNLFVGIDSGPANTGSNNSFFGRQSGRSNTSGAFNSFFGRDAGRQNDTGGSNSFFGANAGVFNVIGESNSFFGDSAGLDSTGSFNSFFGKASGRFNQTGSSNSFFGWQAGNNNSTGTNNSAFGADADVATTNLSFATAIGAGAVVSSSNTIQLGRAGGQDTVSIPGTLAANIDALSVATGLLPVARGGTGVGSSGADGSFLRSTGATWGVSRIRAEDLPTGSNNYIRNQTVQQAGANFNIFGGTGTASVFNATTQYDLGGVRVLYGNDSTRSFFAGLYAGEDATGESNTGIGNRAGGQITNGNRNTVVGSAAGLAITDGNDNTFIGAGAGISNRSGSGNTFIGQSSGNGSLIGSDNTLIGSNTDVIALQVFGERIEPYRSVAIGYGARVFGNYVIQLGTDAHTVVVSGDLAVETLRTSGVTDICLDADNYLSTCSSSLRYKSDVSDYTRGLEVVRKLRPIFFNWNSNGAPDVGFAAEEVATVDPLLATRSASGQIEGVKYKQLTTVLVNAINEQQNQIEVQQKQIDELKALVCEIRPNANTCKKGGGNEK